MKYVKTIYTRTPQKYGSKQVPAAYKLFLTHHEIKAIHNALLDHFGEIDVRFLEEFEKLLDYDLDNFFCFKQAGIGRIKPLEI